MDTPYHQESPSIKPLRALIEIRAGAVEVFAVADSDAETAEIFRALEKFLRGLRKNR